MSIRHVTAIAVIIFLVDQASKLYVVHFLNLKENFAIDVINPILNFRMAWNTGINFGLFDSGGEVSRWILVVLSFVISFGLLWWIRKSKNAVRQISVALIIGGALGNALDRIIFGAVADFLNMSCCGVQNPFSFNLADVAIFLGAFVLIVWDKNEREVA
ncbi:MAG: signal peptidase II [Rhodobacteraceae bacterium]|nr:MAG: signal peptidase II [Paracoccaceae bacterium]